MSECLITKLKGSVDNDLIAKDGEMIFKVEGGANRVFAASYSTPGTPKNAMILIRGNAVPVQLSAPLSIGYKKLDDNPVYVACPSKYNLNSVYIQYPSVAVIDLNYFSPAINLQLNNIPTADLLIKGKMKESTTLNTFSVATISGDIHLEELPVTLPFSSTSGSNSFTLSAGNNKIICNKALDLRDSNLANIYIHSYPRSAQDRITVMSSYSRRQEIFGANLTISGDKSALRYLSAKLSEIDSIDISQYPNLGYFSQSVPAVLGTNPQMLNSKTHTYGTGVGSQYFIGIEYIRMESAEDVDRLLIANAGKPFYGSESWVKQVAVYSTYGRTSASDDAVAQIKAAGGTVIINSDPLRPTPSSASLMSRMRKAADPNPYKVYYKGTMLLFNPEEQPIEVHASSDWSMEAFDTLENAKKFVEDNNLKVAESN